MRTLCCRNWLVVLRGTSSERPLTGTFEGLMETLLRSRSLDPPVSNLGIGSFSSICCCDAWCSVDSSVSAALLGVFPDIHSIDAPLRRRLIAHWAKLVFL